MNSKLGTEPAARRAPFVGTNRGREVGPLLYCSAESPLGTLLLAGTREALHRIVLPVERRPFRLPPEWTRDPDAFADARRQLSEYFAGTRRSFDVRLFLPGTDFQRRVWSALAEIPYGETRTYRDLAQRIGNPKAMRAVGLANGANPVPIVLPCHRVIGADGSLTGFGGGLDAKRFLLDLEGVPARRSQRALF